jgi:uncharacterized OB-fold protein
MTTTPTLGTLHRHQAALDQGKFWIQQCKSCHKHIYFPREICPQCGSDAVDFVAPSGLGTVYAVTTVRRKPADGGDYNVSLIDLDEGPRLMSTITNLTPDLVKIDQRVKAHVEVTEGRGLVKFTVLQGGAA